MITIHQEELSKFFTSIQKQKLSDDQLKSIFAAIQIFINNDTNILRLVRHNLPSEFRDKSMLDLLHTYYQWMQEFTRFLQTIRKGKEYVS